MRIDPPCTPFNRASPHFATITDTIRAMPPTRTQAMIPNALTVLRVLLAAAFFALLAIGLPFQLPGPTPMTGARALLLTAAALFIAAALTDAADGHLARKWNVVSKFGRVMDPFADKLLVLGAFAFLAAPGFVAIDASADPPVRYLATGVHTWMVVVILGRELLVTSIRAVAESAGINFQASWSGKWKMILQSIVVPAVLVGVATLDCRPGSWARWTIDILVWLTVLVTAWSAFPYLKRGIAAMRTSEPTP